MVHFLVVLPWILATALGIALLAARDSGPFVQQLSPWVGGIIGVTLFVVVAAGRADRCWQPRQKPLMARTALWNEAEDTFKRAAERVGVKRGHASTPAAGPDAAAPGATASGAAGYAAAAPKTERWRYVRPKARRPGHGPQRRRDRPRRQRPDLGALPLDRASHPIRVSRAWHGIALGTAGLLSVVSLAIVAMLGMLGENLPDEHREWWSRFRTCDAHATRWPGWRGSSRGLRAMGLSPGDRRLAGRGPAGRRSSAGSHDSLRRAARPAPRTKRSRSTRPRRRRAVVDAGPLRRLRARRTCSSSVLCSRSRCDRRVLRRVSTLVRARLGKGRHWASPIGRVPKDARMVPGRAGGAVVLFSWRVDINEFSIHHFYKNRLVRCYLGASLTAERRPDWFTGSIRTTTSGSSSVRHASTGDGSAQPCTRDRIRS